LISILYKIEKKKKEKKKISVFVSPWDNSFFFTIDTKCPGGGCSSHGICQLQAEGYICYCDRGYTGDDCEDIGIICPLSITWFLTWTSLPFFFQVIKIK